MSKAVPQLRAELEPLPPRMQTLSIDERGYPVPWFVDWVEGRPEFRAMNPQKRCYANSLIMAAIMPELSYVEGVALNDIHLLTGEAYVEPRVMGIAVLAAEQVAELVPHLGLGGVAYTEFLETALQEKAQEHMG